MQRVTLPDGEQVRVVRCRPVDAPADAPVVVCVHGWGCSAFTYHKNLRALADAGLDVYAPDLRGHGWSDKPLDVARYGADALADWLLGLLDVLGIRRAVVVGHSLGAGVVVRAALRDPARVAGLTLLAPVGFGPISRTRLLRLLGPAWTAPVLPFLARRAVFALGLRLGYGRLGRPSRDDVSEYWAPTADPAFVQAVRLISLAFDWEPADSEALTRLACPVHLVLGERDNLVSPAEARRRAAHLTTARVDVVPRAGHVLPEEVPDVVNAAVIADARAWW